LVSPLWWAVVGCLILAGGLALIYYYQLKPAPPVIDIDKETDLYEAHITVLRELETEIKQWVERGHMLRDEVGWYDTYFRHEVLSANHEAHHQLFVELNLRYEGREAEPDRYLDFIPEYLERKKKLFEQEALMMNEAACKWQGLYGSEDVIMAIRNVLHILGSEMDCGEGQLLRSA